MKRLFAVLILISVTGIYLNGQTGGQSITVNPGGTLSIDLSFTDLIINVWQKNEVLLRTSDYQGLNTEYKNNRVIIKQSASGFTGLLTINIPAAFNINIGLGAGNIKLNGDLRGNLEIYNSGGDIYFKNITGKTIIQTGGGDIQGFNIDGSANLKSSGGDISAGSVKGLCSVVTGGGDIKLASSANVEVIKTSGGNVFMKNAAGYGEISSGGGNVSIDNVSGNIRISSLGGDIRINGSKGKIAVMTGGGTIRLKNIRGSINAKTESGDIVADFLSGISESRLTTDNGSIRIGAAGNLRAKIAARTDDREWWNDESSALKNIRSDFKLTSLKRNKSTRQVEAAYELNGGGPLIQVQTDHGEIVIRKN